MNISAHLEALHAKHSKLEASLHEAYIHHDDTSIAKLKRDKLKIKDEIASFLRRLEHTEAA